MSPCQSCHAGCCRSFAVPLTGADILRIERDLSLTFWDFACRWADPEGTISRRYAPQFYFSDEPQTPFVISLTHQASEFLPGSSKCRFLMEGPPENGAPLGEARCGIYHSRPSACRAFPTKFNETGELTVLYDIPTETRSGQHKAYQLCPRPWEVEDIDPIQAPQDLAVAKFEMLFFHSIASVWNQNPREFELFPEFLRVVYERRVMSEQVEAPATIPLPRVETPQRRAA
ncbi:YkgJ family cysteine cluster protein [Calycomorphotria hydatis]|uniref:Flagellin N-methylase n=1 Tax=Calycomorphotria hydatis TaxID=2528027 RepID=A0A517T5M9_9PLAN|nr:YkgJ family cysteine cluster protein [Calycomorphotria hydatis]QDT63680.1 Flagellin N-methylase [Calycomorphotria hydatis]